MRTAFLALGVSVGVVAFASPTFAAPEPPPPPEPDFVTAPSALIQIPAGCPSPPTAEVAFVGTVLDKDGLIAKGTVRYAIDQVRAGDAGEFQVDGVIDVRYGPDSQYLDIDSRYLVAAAIDSDIGTLASKVSPDSPLFGGDAVVGLEDTEVECPVVDDPVQTINLDGTPVEAGLLSPLFDDKRVLLATIGVPAIIVGLVLIGLVLLRRGLDVSFQGIFALGRAAVSPSPDHRASRVRHHASAIDAAYAGDDAEGHHAEGQHGGADDESDSGLVDA